VDAAARDAKTPPDAADAARDAPPLADGFVALPDAPGFDAGPPEPRTWAEVMPATRPPPLHSPRLAYDAARRHVVLYGGMTGVVKSAAMWAYERGTWVPLCDPCAPGARYRHGLAYDAARERVLLFGGTDAGGSARGDLWEWDGLSWRLVAATGDLPSPRWGFGFAYDRVSGRALLFGGDTERGLSDELFALEGTTWRRLVVADAPTPREDEASNAAWSDAMGTLFVLGGRGSGAAVLDDLWALRAGAWSRICLMCTGQPATGRATIWDPTRGRLITAGGWTGRSTVTGTLELEGGSFVTVDAATPADRDNCGIAHDSDRDVIVLYGGNGGCPAGDCDDTFEYRR